MSAVNKKLEQQLINDFLEKDRRHQKVNLIFRSLKAALSIE